MRRKREKVEGKKKARDDDHCPGRDEKVERGHPTQPQKPFNRRMAPMMVARPAPRLSPLPPREAMPDVDRAYDAPCGECKKKNINCYHAETGPTCQACKKSKWRCDHAGNRRGRSASRPGSHVASRAPGPSTTPRPSTTDSHPKSPSPSLAKRRVCHQSRLRPPPSEGATLPIQIPSSPAVPQAELGKQSHLRESEI